MPDFLLPHFGRIDPTTLEEYYEVYVPFKNADIQIDLNFENKTIESDKLEIVKRFIENIRIHDINNLRQINTDFNSADSDTVIPYLEHHLEELGSDDLSQLINVNTKPEVQKEQLLKNLHLVRVGIYPDSETGFGVFDYSINKDMTDQVVAIFTDENGNFDGMTIES